MAQVNLTQGNIGKTLLSFSVPMVLSSLLQSLYSIIDLMLAGHFVGDSAMSAISNAGQVTTILTQIIIGITVGANILIGQYYGGKKHHDRHETGNTLFAMAVLLGFLGMVILYFTGESILSFLKAPALAEATTYIQICAFGIIPIFVYNALSAMMRGVGNSRHPLYFIAITATVNLVLDIIFMWGFQMGTAGAAYATLISQVLCFLMALIYIVRENELYALKLRHLSISREKFKNILRLGIPTAIQMTVVGISWLTMTFLINDYGVNASAASGIAAKIKDLTLLFSVAMSTATGTMVAQCLGAGEFDRARKAVHIAMRIAIAVSILLIIIVEIFAPQLVALFGASGETATIAIENLRIEILGQVFFASFMVYNALPTGAGHTIFTLCSSLMNCIVVRLILAIILNQHFGLTGVFWACMWAPLSSVPLGYIYERSGVWRKSLAK